MGLPVTLRVVQFLALVLIALVPAGAHLFELPNKIGLPQDQYFIVQQIYRGWALFGSILFGALGASLALTILLRRHGAAFWLALAGFTLIAATLAIFFTWTYPANQATSNWTVAPPNWAELRVQWEYAHAANAVLTFAAFCLIALSALSKRGERAR
jgi:hypothetical protein